MESLFALHDHAYNKDWLKKWTSQWFLTTEDLDDIRNRLGEKVGILSFLKDVTNDLSPDCLLLRFHPILFCLSSLPSCLWS